MFKVAVLAICLASLSKAALADPVLPVPEGLGLGLVLPQEVEITNRSGPLRGQAALVPGAMDLVLIVPGGGPIDRDGNGLVIGLETDSYALLAKGLEAQGISSIRIDKRGFYRSRVMTHDGDGVPIDGAMLRGVKIADYAQDLRDWVDFAQPQARCVWLAGHSEGGIVALVAALAPPQGLCGVILLAVPGRPVGQLVLRQMDESPLLRPMLPAVRQIITSIEGGQLPEPASIPMVLRPFFPLQVQQHMLDLFRHDPAQIARIWDGPALILQGDRDLQVPTEDASLLAQAMPQAQLEILAGATHMLKEDQPDLPFATYSDPGLPLHPDLVGIVAGFIRTHQP